MSKQGALHEYLKSVPSEQLETKMVAYLASLQEIAEVAPEVSARIVNELSDQRQHLKLIASENYSSLACQLAMGNLLTDKYAEGYPYHRFYAGCDNVDALEDRAASLARELFGADHAYVQSHSGADANLAAYWAILYTRVQVPALEELGITNPSDLSRQEWDTIRHACGNQRLLGLDYYSGGHLTHGYRHNISAQMFDVYNYTVDEQSGLLDYDAIEKLAHEVKPLILLAGYSAYPRLIDFERMSKIAQSVGATFMVDMAHFAGLVAGKVMRGSYDPVAWADVVTTTTHKTLRGPRGGLILCKESYAEAVDKGCPLVLGGPLPQMIAAKVVALTEALKPEFAAYAEAIVKNSAALAQACLDEQIDVATGGSDNHLMLLDIRSFGLNGRQAESALRLCGMTLNRNALPFDPNGPWYTSGLRVGTPAVTTLGMGDAEMREIASIIKLVLANTKPTTITKGDHAGELSKARAETPLKIQEEARARVKNLLSKFVLYPELDLAFLTKHFPLTEH